MQLKNIIYRLLHWETWPYLVKYIPIMPVWVWYCARARSFWFFTSSNPTLTFGGFEGESKSEMYKQLPPHSFPKSIFISPALNADSLLQEFNRGRFSFPVAVKPDIGMMGLMFRKISNSEELLNYHSLIGTDYIIQEMVSLPMEVSVFYYRYPDRQNGTITGFLKKEFLEVTGDGVSTLETLIENYDRVRFRKEEMLGKHAAHLNDILAPGKVYVLSPALNLSRGGRLVSLAHEIDAKLLQIFDELSAYTKHFYYGRFDIKCESIAALKEGKFSILEYNGCGAEPHHAYGNKNTLLQAYRIFLHHWKVLYKISEMNRNKGIEPWSFSKGRSFLTDAKKHFRRLRKLDKLYSVD